MEEIISKKALGLREVKKKKILKDPQKTLEICMIWVLTNNEVKRSKDQSSELVVFPTFFTIKTKTLTMLRMCNKFDLLYIYII